MVVSCEVARYIDLPLNLPDVEHQAAAINVAPDSIVQINVNADIGAALAQKVEAALIKARSTNTEDSDSDGQDTAPSLDSIDIAVLRILTLMVRILLHLWIALISQHYWIRLAMKY